ncbi:MAG: amidohydrolase [Anaerolineae bacterium]|nr:amidohydrolase [Anaerolineae bacterium]
MKSQQDVIEWIDQNRARFIDITDQIWARPEVAWQEFYASKLQADALEAEGFRITWDIAGISTAFAAEWGTGSPVLGFAGEYDALAGLSQQAKPTQEPIAKGAPGHACGHNLLGTGCMAAAIAVRHWLEATGTPGTVRYYGCPAEERTSGKTFMARAGAFDDLDAALNYHPDRMNAPTKGTHVGVYDLTFRFHGTAAHAGGSPHKGRSALDAVELMNVGVNYLREHVTEKVRIHYVITHGGDLPNVVPPEAEVWYFVRAPSREELDQVTDRVRDIAQGAALMTGTTVDSVFNGACSTVLSNHYLADMHHRALQRVGPIPFTEEERAYAQAINDAYPAENVRDLFKDLNIPEEVRDKVETLKGEPLIADNLPALDEGQIHTGSTDVGDLSWITPLCMLRTTCFASGASGHSWGIVATSGMSIGHKGMLHAAKVMALVAIDLFADPEHLEHARREFEEATRDRPYTSPIPDHVSPPHHVHPERDAR